MLSEVTVLLGGGLGTGLEDGMQLGGMDLSAFNDPITVDIPRPVSYKFLFLQYSFCVKEEHVSLLFAVSDR